MKDCFSRSVLIVVLLMVFASSGSAQTKADKKLVKQLQTDIEYLASDELEGRRTGSVGEQKAADYLIAQYRKNKIEPFRGDYKHPFSFVYGREIAPETFIQIGNEKLTVPRNAFPLPFSGNSAQLTTTLLPDVFEPGNVWMIGLYTDKEEADDPHFDYEKRMFTRAEEAAKQGATAVIFYDSYGAKYPPVFNRHSEFESLEIPIVFLGFDAYEKAVLNRPGDVAVTMEISLKKPEYTGTNIAAYINNNAPFTVVIGAHYDHLGYGDDGSSLYAGKDRQIHNGADDNASGTAGLLALAERIKKKKLSHYNYLFLNFSGEELGLLGSKAFVKEMKLDSNSIAYMINMDMVGRLNDSTHALTIGGVGTSPVWGQFIADGRKEFKISIDSSGIGPSDHTSFYQAGIPVLFFFTGTHHDYHKPTDDAGKINYEGEVQVLNFAWNIISAMDKMSKPLFTATKQNNVGKVRFKVTLGIMPDYSYQDAGVRVDGVLDDRPAMKAGIKTGDIITRLGEYKVLGMQSYMEALSKYESGQTVDVTVLRNGELITMKLTF